MASKKFLPYARQSISEADIEAVAEALRSPFITRGPQVEAFEKEVANYVGSHYAVAFNSGTSALFAAYHAVELSSADRVLTTPITFVATAAPAFKEGARVVFLDVDPLTANMDLDQLALNVNKPTSRGKTIVVPVHFAGLPLDMAELDRVIRDPKTVVIEDACHALGAIYPDGSRVGSCRYSQATVFSFHPAKGVTTGEGGIVTTNDEVLYRRLLRYRNNGIERDPKREEPWYYEVREVTGNFHMTEMQAALGHSQFKKLGKFVTKRRELVAYYRQELAGLPLQLLTRAEDDELSAHHLLVVLFDFEALNLTRTQLMNFLREEGVGSQVHYIPLYRMPFLGVQEDLTPYFPSAENYYAQALSLPLFSDMNRKDVDRVVAALKKALLSSSPSMR